MVVENVVFVFVYDVHCTQDVKGIVNTALNVFEINSLSFLYKQINE